MAGHSRTETARLVLTRPSPDDLDELFSLHSDPTVWTHLPSGRHRTRTDTEQLVNRHAQSWRAHGLGMWVARTRVSGPAGAEPAGPGPGQLVGIGGCSVRDGAGWNLYYRLSPAWWGQGFAQEIITAARSAAEDVRPDLPVVAYLLEHNHGSKAAAERAGLQLVWRGPDAGNPDPEAVRLVYADRPLATQGLATFTR